MRVERRARLTPARRALLDRCLDELLDLDPGERQQRLDTLAQRCPRLHGPLARLVAASATPTRYLDQAVHRIAQRALADGEQVDAMLPAGARLGAWRIEAPAGRGGMGVVYRAERADGAFDMPAALKLIRGARPALSKRLAMERQLLARLDHPGISRLIDGGMTEDGRAWLAMEWVSGSDLARCQLDGIDRLEVFCQVADAVTHAHQRMVIHGDIKPGNVRIQPDGRARLLDFGVARLLAAEGEAEDQGLRALTPAYAAPELLTGTAATAQSDIWALGALLEWLLTGRHPESGRPASASQLAHPRAADLAAIIARACAPDPAARYESAAALKDEVRRIIDHHPIEARPVGRLGQLGWWSRRNPLAAALAGLALTLVIGGTSLLAWQARIVAAERDLARVENARWEIMRDQLVSLFQAISQEGSQDDRQARDILDDSVGQLSRLLGGDPDGETQIRSLLGSLYVALQDYQNAAAILRPFVDADDGSVTPMLRSEAYGHLAVAEERLGRFTEALNLSDQAIAMVERLPGDYRRRLLGLHQTRGRALRGLGDWSAAIEALDTGLALARRLNDEPNREVAQAENNLGVTLLYAGRLNEAQQAFEMSLTNWRALGLSESSDAINVLSNLTTVYHRQGNLAAAERLYAESIALRRARFGDSAALAAAMNNYGQVLIIRHRLDEAAEQLEQARDMMARFAGETSPDHAIILRSLGSLVLTAGDPDRALDKLNEAEAIMLGTLGPDHLFTAIIRAQAAMALGERDQQAARTALAQLIAQMEGMGPPAEPHQASALCEKAVLLLDMGLPDAALGAAEACLSTRQARLPDGNWETLKAETLVAAAEHQLGASEALATMTANIAALAEVYGPGHPRLAWLEGRLIP